MGDIPKSRPIIIAVCLSVFLIGFFFLVKELVHEPLAHGIERYVQRALIVKDSKNYGDRVDAIYVLGGSQSSLEFKYRTASQLYQKGMPGKILLLRRPGKTEYSPVLNRNLTNDEWSTLKMERLGVPRQAIELIALKKGFFGTLTEAETLSELIIKRRYRYILLITSPYHTRRVKISFERFLRDRDVNIAVLGSEEKASLRELLIEFAKLMIYQIIVSGKQ